MTGLSVTIGVWHEAGRDERRCPGYYAADWEVLRTVPGDYPLRLTFEGGYTMPMPYWLLARIDATRIDGREYSGFGGNNFASNALAVGEKPLHVQMYAYQLAELVAAGRVTVFPEFVGLVDRAAQLEWARGKSWADLQALATVGGQLAMTRANDLTAEAIAGWSLNMAEQPAYLSSPAGMAFHSGLAHRACGRPIPAKAGMSRGYSVRIDATIYDTNKLPSVRDLATHIERGLLGSLSRSTS